MAGDAKRKAAGAMKDAIGNVERISVASEDDIARKYDRRRFEGQLVDPATGKPYGIWRSQLKHFHRTGAVWADSPFAATEFLPAA